MKVLLLSISCALVRTIARMASRSGESVVSNQGRSSGFESARLRKEPRGSA